MAARRRKARRSLGSVKVCKVVRGKVKCRSAKSSLSGMKRRRRRLGSVVLGRMPKRNSKGRFVRGR